jgi:tetratricopeptide (TPR) repeat protein
LLRRLCGALDLAGSGGLDLPPRQRTMRDTIAWSYRLLDRDEQVALQRLSVFPNGVGIDGAQEMLDGIGETDPLQLLESLLRKSLLRRAEDGHGDVRLGLLASIREYARDELDRSGDAPAVRDRHAAYIARIAQETAARLHSADQRACLATFDQELESLQAALEWLADSERTDEALSLAHSLRWYWSLRGHLSASDRWLRRLLALPRGNDVVRGHGLITAGMIALDIGDRRRARALYTEAIALLGGSGDADALAWARTGLGAVVQAEGDLAAAERLQEASLAAFRSTGDLLGQCTANTRIAMMSLSQGQHADAEQRFNTSLAVRRQLGDPWGTSFVLTSLGMMRLLDDDFPAATAYLEEALELVREIGNTDGIARILDALGTVDAAAQRWEDAAAKFHDALALYEEVGNRAGAALALTHLARAELSTRAAAHGPAKALRAYADASAIGDSVAVAAAVETVASALALASHGVEAARLLGAAEGIRQRQAIAVSPRHVLGAGACRTIVDAAMSADEVDAQLAVGRAMGREQIAAAIEQATGLLGVFMTGLSRAANDPPARALAQGDGADGTGRRGPAGPVATG